MIPRAFYALFALYLVAFVSAVPQSEQIETPEYVDVPSSVLSSATSSSTLRGGSPLPRVCRRLEVRKEWRDLNTVTKLDYIRAVKCLQNTRAENRTLARKFTRYDQFVITHSNVADRVHGVGQFLPWHRHYGYLYHQALRGICNYVGPFPYWDWTRDGNGNTPIPSSPIFNTITGFGGDGVPGTYTFPTDDDGSSFPAMPEIFKGCVQTGPFANTVLHVGPNRRFTDHCLVRSLSNDHRSLMTTPYISGNILSQTTYDNFWNSLDGVPFKPDVRLHDAGHATVGGDMSTFYTSPNDPVFYPHHAGLDRIWDKWQRADVNSRLYAMEGQVNYQPPYGQVTLDYQLPFPSLGPSVSIRETMDIHREPYCYTYAN